MTNSAKSLDNWYKRLEFFQEQEALISDVEQKFSLRLEIEECQEKIEYLLRQRKTGSEPVKPENKIQLDADFLEKCRQELANYIGPIANFLIKDTLAKHPEITRESLINTLANNIDDVKDARNFKSKLSDF